MINFTKENLIKTGGGCVVYAPNGKAWDPDNKFVARFKHGRGGPATFMTHLRKKWTVEEYFAAYDAGLAPLEIVRKTGYLQPHIKKWLKRDGYPATMSGYNAWKADAFTAAARIS